MRLLRGLLGALLWILAAELAVIAVVIPADAAHLQTPEVIT